LTGRRRDGAWLQAVARSRAIELPRDRADELAAAADPILSAFDVLVSELTVDDDIDDFRRVLDAERGGGA
jgi:hypothetical protein